MAQLFKLVRSSTLVCARLVPERCILKEFCTGFKNSSTRNVSTVNTSSFQVNISNLTPISSNSQQWIWQKQTPIVLPVTTMKPLQEFPTIYKWNIPLTEPTVQTNEKEVSEPGLYNESNRKEAARLIVIRRKKMKKHKLKKLRKRMKYEWAKIRQRRELRKEKEFQAVLIGQCKQAEAFNAEEYVKEKLRQAAEVPIPRFWKGKRLPEFIIRQKLGLPPK